MWDWYNDSTKETRWSDGPEYSHIALIGDCSGLLLDDYFYYVNSTDIRELIYTDPYYPSNLERMTILQEPITRWFKPIDGKPYFNNGLTDIKLISQYDLKDYFNVDIIKGFDDALAMAQDTDGNIFGENGYRTDVRLDDNGNIVNSEGYNGSTGLIACKYGDIIYATGIDLIASHRAQDYDDKGDGTIDGDGMVKYIYLDQNYNKVMLCKHPNVKSDWYYGRYYVTDDGFRLEIPTVSALANVAYIRFGFNVDYGLGAKPMISVNKPISYTTAGFLADGIKVDDDNIESAKLNTLQDKVDQFEYDVTTRFDNLSITTDQTDFILQSDGEEVKIPKFTEIQREYEMGRAYDDTAKQAATIINVTSDNMLIKPISVSLGDVLRIRGIDFSDVSGRPRVYAINKSDNVLWAGDNMYAHIIQNGKISGSASNGNFTYEWDAVTKTLTITFTTTSGGNNWASSRNYAFSGMLADGYTANSVIMTLNQEITYNTVINGIPERFKDNLYAQSVLLTSPGGNRFTLTVSDDGVLTATALNK